MRILGIDPGLGRTGFAVVEKRRRGFFFVMYGEIGPVKGASLSDGLKTIYQRLLDVIGETRPDCMVVEDVFYGKNVKSLIRQSHVRGVAILAGAHSGTPIFEYSPLEIKKAVVGYGRAEKRQVQMMVRAILNLTELPPPDAADAMAVAICHAHFLKVECT
ncbi:MAG: crossover junction endodeoxyribonuclease RuvC [Pseudomonadota bacterium]